MTLHYINFIQVTSFS